jgi:hypothetical protein
MALRAFARSEPQASEGPLLARPAMSRPGDKAKN